MKRPVVLSAVSGCLWAAIAWYIVHERPVLTRVVIALVTLYLATAVWGTAVGLTTFFFRARTAFDLFAPAWLAVVVLTSGWFIVLWPLAYLNHFVIGRTWAGLEIWPGWSD